MKIIVSEIEEEGVTVDLSETYQQPSGLKSLGPISAHLVIERIGEEVTVNGDITGVVNLQCSRCLIDFQKEVSLSVDLIYHPLKEVSSEEAYEIPRDETDIGFYRNDELDISEMVKEQVLLNLPMKPLCDEQCKGLCPMCGADLNLQPCDCSREDIDPRLAKLKKLLLDRKES